MLAYCVSAAVLALCVASAVADTTSETLSATHGAQETQSPRVAQSLKAKNMAAKALLVVHYARADKNYDRWNAWCWPEGGEGAAYPFTGKDAFGRYAVIPFKEKPKGAGFIIRLGEWEQKDTDHDRTITFDTGDAQEIWLVAGADSDKTITVSPITSISPVAIFVF